MKQNGINRRQFLQWSALTTGAAVLAACAPAAAPSAATGEEAPAAAPSTVSYWYAWGNLDPAMAKIIETEEFQTHLGGATVEYKGSTNSDALLTAVAAGTPPEGASNYSYVELVPR